MSPLWQDVPIHVLDFEGSARTGVIEYGVATLLRGEITATHTRLCAPLASVPTAETRCHGLRESDLAGTAPFSADWELFSGLRREGILCAHHAATEHTLLKTVWAYPGAMPDPAHPGEFLNDWTPWLDTHRLALVWNPNLADHKLGTLVHHFALEAPLAAVANRHCPPTRRRPHCALYDALAAALLLCHLCHRHAKANASNTAAATPRTEPNTAPNSEPNSEPNIKLTTTAPGISLETLILASLPPSRQIHRIQNSFDFS